MNNSSAFSRAHRRSAAAMGLTPEELADRQRLNRERRRQREAAKLAAKALAAGISITEMRERIKANKAAARIARQAAEHRRELVAQAHVLLAEANWRGAVLRAEDRKVLRLVTSPKGFRKVEEQVVVETLKRVGDTIDVLAVANAKRLLNVALGAKESLQ